MARARTLVLNTKVNVTGADQLRGLGRTLQRTGATLSVAVTAPLALLGGVAARAASDLNESFNAVNVTFGETADAINAIGETSAESFGLSKRAFNEAAIRFSAFASTVAGEGGDVAGTIEELVGRATDFASVFNLDVEDALALFQSGLAGETEPLRRFGKDLSAAAVEAHALATGISDGIGPLTEAEKVQARYSLLMQQTADVADDFANTQGEVANQQRIAAAAAEDAAAALGQKFLPIQQKVIGLLSDAIDAWTKLPAPMQDAIVIFGVAAAALGPLLLGLGSLIRLVGVLGSAKAIAGISSLGLAFKSLIGPIGLALAAGELLNIGLSNLNKTIGGAPGALQRLGETLGRDVREIAEAAKVVADETGIAIETIVTDLDALVAAGFGWEEALKAVARGMDAVEWEEHQADIAASGKAWEDYTTVISDAMFGTGGAVPTMAGATDEMADDAGELPGEMADAMLAEQQRLADATTQLVTFMEQALEPAQEIANLQGFLASAELAQGLIDNREAVRTKARELRDAAAARLQELTGIASQAGTDAGYAFHVSLAAAMGASRWMVYAEAVRTASAIRGVMPSSEPKDPNSPLRGITKGFGFGEVLARGILSGQGAVTGAFRDLVGGGLSMPTLSPAAGGAGGQNITNITLQWDGEPPKGRSEEEIISTLQRLIPMVDTLRPVF